MTNLVVFAVWKNAAGQTISVGSCGIHLEGLGAGVCYLPVFNVPSGTYAVNLFAWSVQDQPLSLTVSVQVST